MAIHLTTQSRLALVQTMIAGFQKHYASGSSITIASTVYTLDELVQHLQKLALLYEAQIAAKTQAHSTTVALRTEVKTDGPFMRALRSFLLGAFTDAKDLADFGLVPRKTRTPPTGEKIVKAARRRKATRVARHTLGKRQKADIKGVDPGPGGDGSSGSSNATGATGGPAAGAGAPAPGGGAPQGGSGGSVKL